MHKRALFPLLMLCRICHFGSHSNRGICCSPFFSALPSTATLFHCSSLKMTHIKDLHLNILRKVLAYFYDGVKPFNMEGFKKLLPPAAVCRVWRECMLRYIYYTAHLEYHVKETDERMETTLPNYVWKSNIDLVVSQHVSSAVRRLRIDLNRCSLRISDMIYALDALGFSSNHWRAVNVLHINRLLIFAVNDNSSSSSDDEAFATQLTEYLGRHLPNIGDLFIDSKPGANISRLLSNKLVNMYIRQLHALDCSPAPITFNCHSFSSKLRNLSVAIASGVMNRLPQLLASPLETLSLVHVPHNFAWWTFIGIAPGHVEFTNLHYLRLEFHQQPENPEESNSSNRQVSMGTISLNIGYRKLFFPKLKELIIVNSPFNDGVLCSMFVRSPLRRVNIDSSFKSVEHMDLHILVNAEYIRFHIHSVSPDDYNDYVEFYHKLLGTPSNAGIALLGVFQSSVPLPIPSTIEWINLRQFTLNANVHLASVIQVVVQLPKLDILNVENVVDEANEAGAILQAILGGSPRQLPSVATNVKRLRIYSGYRLPLVFSLDVMRYLTILVHSLDEVIVPDLYIFNIKLFANYNADMFPHLRNIKVRGTIRGV